MLPAAYDIAPKAAFVLGAGCGIGKGMAQVRQPQGPTC